DIVLAAKEGAERHIQYSGAPIRNVDGEIVGIVLIFRDITEQMRLEEQLRHSQKMDSIGQLAGGVAHDFNNMLFGISGAAELIAKVAGKNAEVIKFADTIMDATQRAADLTQKLLAFSRKAKVQSTLLDVHSCIVQAVQILLHTIDRRIKIGNALDADITTVNGDPTQIQNLVLNLGLNARDAMPGGGELTISTANVNLNEVYCKNSLFAIEPGPFMEISIRDTGFGMNKKT
ncbi:MAG: PAS domain S-box protein, partial [bacterium]|nr:PAS domain S-box protein [bacterium]